MDSSVGEVKLSIAAQAGSGVTVDELRREILPKPLLAALRASLSS